MLPEEEAARNFFAAFGHALFAACQLQYRLAQLYGGSFETVADGCLPRVHEKKIEALEKTLGKSIEIAREAMRLAPDVVADLEVAHRFRDYIAHRLFIETRSRQRAGEGFNGLIDRLNDASQFFMLLGQRLDALHDQVFLNAGISLEQLESCRKPWDEHDDEAISYAIPIPKARERIVAAWSSPGRFGPQIILEGEDGKLWQLVDNGCAHFPGAKEDGWQLDAGLQRLLPDNVKMRPNRKSNPPEYRGAYHYDLRFERGSILRIARGGKNRLTYEIVRPRGGSKRKSGRK
jgi:hypothetical protein